jgi:hypothetical protein
VEHDAHSGRVQRRRRSFDRYAWLAVRNRH